MVGRRADLVFAAGLINTQAFAFAKKADDLLSGSSRLFHWNFPYLAGKSYHLSWP